MKNLKVFMVIALTLIFNFLSQIAFSQLIIERIGNGAIITSSDYNYGYYKYLLDSNIYTYWYSADINPAFVQFEFSKPENVDSIAVFIGQFNSAPHFDMNEWWLEVADNQYDMDNKIGTYLLLIDKGEKNSGVWQIQKFDSPITKRIWKFNVHRTVGDDKVYISELGMFRKIDISKTKRKYRFDIEEAANNVVVFTSCRTLSYPLFDGDISNAYTFNPNDNTSNLFINFIKPVSFENIRIITKNECEIILQYADNFDDFVHNKNSYTCLNPKKFEPNQWDSIVFSEPISKKIINFLFIKKEDSLTVNEIEFYSENKPDTLIGIQDELILWEGWRWRNIPENVYLYGVAQIPIKYLEWSSTDETIATVDTNGFIKALKSGTANIIGKYNEYTCSTKVIVKAKVKESDKEILSGKLATPSENCVFEMPILIIRMFATSDGIYKDPVYMPEFWDCEYITIDSAKTRSMKYIKRFKLAIEEGSKFRRYKYPDARPSIGIKIVDILNVYEPIGPGLRHTIYSNGLLQYSVDYQKIFDDLNVKNYIENHNVKQIWFINCGYNATSYSYNPDYHKPEFFRGNFESFMSSPGPYPTCNGVNPEPLPIYNQSYTVICIDNAYPDFVPQNFEPFTHQFEALFKRQNILQDYNTQFFWDKFVGKIGRCGWTHCPPNTEINYGYFKFIQEDTSRVKPTWSDIEDWKPDNSGEKTLVTYHSWEDLVYEWYDGELDFDGRSELQWFIYWLQSLPGFENNIPYEYLDKSYRMTNWWKFVYDWDKYTTEGIGLWEEINDNSIDDVQNNEAIEIYPNPVYDNILINNIKPGSKIYLYDFYGRKVFDSVSDKNYLLIDVSNYSQGCYLIKIDNFSKLIMIYR